MSNDKLDMSDGKMIKQCQITKINDNSENDIFKCEIPELTITNSLLDFNYKNDKCHFERAEVRG